MDQTIPTTLNQRYRVTFIALLLFGCAISKAGLLPSRALGQNAYEYTERVPVAQVQMERREETVYTTKPVESVQSHYRTVLEPVTTLCCEPRLHNWWNPLTGPYVSYHMTPRTHWQPRTERVETRVTRYQYIPETRIVERPVRRLGFANRRVIANNTVPSRPQPRIVQRTAPSQVPIVVSPQRVARHPSIGGLHRLDNDPPRQAMPSSATLYR